MQILLQEAEKADAKFKFVNLWVSKSFTVQVDYKVLPRYLGSLSKSWA